MVTRLPNYPMARTCPFDPAPELGELREHNPVAKVTLWSGKECWVITRYDDARAVLHDPRFSASAANPNFPATTPGRRYPSTNNPFSRIDDPRHQQIRQMVADRFTIKAVSRLRPQIQDIVDGQITTMLAGPRPTDAVAAIAQPLPGRMISQVLGIPPEDIPYVSDCVHRFAERRESAHDAQLETRAYVERLVSMKELQPDDCLVSTLVVRQLRTGRITRNELIDLSQILLTAGHATTVATIGIGLVSVLEDRALFEAIRSDAGRTRRLVDEILRYHVVVADGVPRVAQEDVIIRGTRIRAGDPVMVSLSAANRDGRRFADPDTVNTERRNLRSQLGFGNGIHVCLGQHLARLEMQIAYSTLAQRVPTLRLATPVERLRFRHDMVIYGVHELPITW